MPRRAEAHGGGDPRPRVRRARAGRALRERQVRVEDQVRPDGDREAPRVRTPSRPCVQAFDDGAERGMAQAPRGRIVPGVRLRRAGRDMRQLRPDNQAHGHLRQARGGAGREGRVLRRDKLLLRDTVAGRGRAGREGQRRRQGSEEARRQQGEPQAADRAARALHGRQRSPP